MRLIAGAIAAISASISFYCAYAFVFYAWLTATPLEPVQLIRAQSLANFWLGLCVLTLAIAISGLVLIFRRRPKL